MAVNFASRNLGASAVSDKPSLDDLHSVANLIASSSTNAASHGHGFLTASFVKPPVSVTITFACAIDICCVELGLRVGVQKSSAVQVLTYAPALYGRSLVSSDASAGGSGGAGEELQLYRPVGWHASTDKDEKDHPADAASSVVRLFNALYRPRAPFVAAAPPPPLMAQHVTHGTLHCNDRRQLSYVLGLVVRIVRTTSGRIPALSCVRVWGQPARDAGRTHASDLALRLLAEADAAARLAVKLPSSRRYRNSATEDENAHHCISGTNGAEEEGPCRWSPRLAKLGQQCVVQVDKVGLVPSEFVDPITCEVMSLPLLLPSGNSIDQSTWERFIAAEALWGRGPSDPFTGVNVHGDRAAAVPNMALKARLDLFLLEHNVDVTAVAQTVGSGRQAYGHCRQDVGTRGCLKSLLTTCPEALSGEAPHKKSKVECEPLAHASTLDQSLTKPLLVTDKIETRAITLSSGKDNRTHLMVSGGVKGSSSSSAATAENHEVKMAVSLEKSLQEVLASLPTFRNRSNRAAPC